MNKLNISSMEVLPEDITEAFTGIHSESDLWCIECKLTKQVVPVSDLAAAAQNLNVSVQTELDGDGKPVYPDRDRVSLYHTAQSWKDKGLLNPGTDGPEMDTRRLRVEDYITTRSSGKRHVKFHEFQDG